MAKGKGGRRKESAIRRQKAGVATRSWEWGSKGKSEGMDRKLCQRKNGSRGIWVKESIGQKGRKERKKERKKERNKSNRVRTTDAFWQTARVLVFKSSFKWHSFMFLMLFCSNSAHFSEIQLVCDLQTDGRTDGWRVRRTDTTSYRGSLP